MSTEQKQSIIRLIGQLVSDSDHVDPEALSTEELLKLVDIALSAWTEG